MSTRALARAGLHPTPHIDLPVGLRPQIVNAEGYQVAEDELEGDVVAETTNDGVDGAGGDVPVSGVAMVEEQDADDHEEGEPETPEQLISLAESLVLPFSLTQTRQRHLAHLLPHAFSHPPIPSHSKPRARLPPRSTFLFPTPPPPVQPLPLKEFHGAHRSSKATTQDSSVEGRSPDASPAPKTKSKAKAKELGAPAHETECISRITLSIGPLSFPGTELWVGRFVEPRSEPIKRERKKDKRNALSEALAARVKPTSTPRSIASPKPPAQPTRSPLVRPPNPSAAAGTHRPGFEPNVMQRVNQAAIRHPWLSDIIHRAARKAATQEELLKLGRVITHFGKGGVSMDGPLFSPPSTRPPAATPRSSSSISAQPANTVTADDDDTSSLSDVDMSGPEQVGGGPLDPELLPDVAKKPSPVPPSNTSTTSTLGSTPFRPQAPMYNYNSPSTRPPLPTPLSTPQPSTSTIQTPRPLYNPPEPRRVYPYPPPFLVIAFRETPTEKYLLPFGSLSYLSRVGGDHVTHPAPPPVESLPVVTPVQSPAPATSKDESGLGPQNSGSRRGRTRASLGRHAKDHKEEPTTPVPEAKIEVPEIVIEKVEPPKSSLPPLSGLDPKKGTVLLSTFVPTTEWNKPDWQELGRRLPFDNPEFDDKPMAIKTESSPAESTALPAELNPLEQSAIPSSPVCGLRHIRVASSFESKVASKRKRSLLNLSAEDFIPEDGSVQAVTIRLEGLDDRAWARVKRIAEMVETAEMKAMGDDEPSLLEQRTQPQSTTSATPQGPMTKPSFNPSLHPRLRRAYSDRRRARFERLLQRVPPRTFPKYRLVSARTDIIEGTTERWGPRPYPLSTKPLYLTSPPPEGEGRMIEADFLPPPPKKKRNQIEEEQVMFEMPVSLDQLDERVEQGARRSVSKRGGKLGRPRKLEDPNKKRYGKRYVMGRICEGCGGEGLKVWRRGPGGKGTLCHPCGDKFLSGTLGELKAPGAASSGKKGEGTGEDAGADGDEEGSATEENVKNEQVEGGEPLGETSTGPGDLASNDQTAQNDSAAIPPPAKAGPVDQSDGLVVNETTATVSPSGPGTEAQASTATSAIDVDDDLPEVTE